MADQKYNKHDEPQDGASTETTPVDAGCGDVQIPEDPTWDPEATHHD